MGVFDGGAYRLSVRHADGDETSKFIDDEPEARIVTSQLRAAGAQAVEVDYVHFVVSDHDPGLSFGDYWGDGEYDEEEGDE
ncbi:hypothetical protein OG436_29580 [Streptomyces caniferus]|uniref:hypothetical protein n=1 Tax=Streptomyces caniferus TaxID=285557 RepID=UPI002E292481|nr:hypothetical protein [Streptomyces caniferus]